MIASRLHDAADVVDCVSPSRVDIDSVSASRVGDASASVAMHDVNVNVGGDGGGSSDGGGGGANKGEGAAANAEARTQARDEANAGGERKDEARGRATRDGSDGSVVVMAQLALRPLRRADRELLLFRMSRGMLKDYENKVIVSARHDLFMTL